MEFVVSYDLRAPAFGTPAREIYAATLDQCAWADDVGFDVVELRDAPDRPGLEFVFVCRRR